MTSNNFEKIKKELRDKAIAASLNSHSPYSHEKVGSAVLSGNNKYFSYLRSLL